MNFAFGSPALDAASRLMTPFILMFGAYVVMHGHDSPGGGFQGGVIIAACVILVRLVRGRAGGWNLSPETALALTCAGVGIFVGVGLLGPISVATSLTTLHFRYRSRPARFALSVVWQLRLALR